MDIHLRPELEEQIRQDIQRGPYQTVERAVSLLHEQETWLASHRDEIAGKIEEGWNAAVRGELASDKKVQAHMQERKRAWSEQQRPA